MSDINIRVKNKKDTEDNWMHNDPVLLDGELVISVVDGVQKMKLGNGSSKYSELPFTDETMMEAMSWGSF